MINRGETVERLAFEATLEAIQRTRRTIVVMIGLVCLSLFHLYMFYGSWELARIAGRKAVITVIEKAEVSGRILTGSARDDERLKTSLEEELGDILKRRGESQFTPPLVGVEVATNDYSIALQMVSVAVLLWLGFNQKRLNYCLREIEKISGWGPALRLLELHFGLISSGSDRQLRVVSRALPLSLPIISVLFVGSDIFDFYRMANSPWKAVAFEDPEFVARVTFRLLSGMVMGIVVFVLGLWSFREWRRTEEGLVKLTRPRE